MKLLNVSCILAMLFVAQTAMAQEEWGRKFEQLGTELPTPNSYRNGAGAPGVNYWQQRADYKIDVSIDDETQVLRGSEETSFPSPNITSIIKGIWLNFISGGRKFIQEYELLFPMMYKSEYEEILMK